MDLDEINHLSMVAAAVASFVFGSVYYGVLGQAWMTALAKTEEELKPTPSAMTFFMTFICLLVIAYTLMGTLWHMVGPEPTVFQGLISGGLLWAGIVLTTQIVNHRFQNQTWALTVIDGGHWLGVLLIQGTVLGLMKL